MHREDQSQAMFLTIACQFAKQELIKRQQERTLL
jgi:hypothetical protein